MYLNEETVAKLNIDADKMGYQFDVIISQYVQALTDDNGGGTPFVILAAVASVLTKLAMITDNNRDFIFESLKDMIPDNDALKAMNEGQNNVIPITVAQKH